MSDIKKEHKKFGKATLYCMLIEEKINDLCKECEVNPKEKGRYISFPEKVDILKSSKKMKTIFKKKHRDGHKKKRKEFNEYLKVIKSWWNLRNDLRHIEEIPFDDNDEFKDFLKTGMDIIKYFEINLPEEYDEDKYNAIGRFVYQSTFVEIHVEEKCKNRNIKIRDKNGHRISMNKKIKAIIDTKPKKPEKFCKIEMWWKKRNGLLHSVDKMNRIKIGEIYSLIAELEEWPEILSKGIKRDDSFWLNL